MAGAWSPTLLVADAGNTKVRFAVWTGGGQELADTGGDGSRVLVAPEALPTRAVLATPSDPASDTDFLAAAAAVRDAAAGWPLVLVSVVPRVVPLLHSLWPDLLIVDFRSPLPFRLDLPNPAGIGPDRLCNVAAAASAGLRRALVVDAGTATTFDLLLDGEFRGGLIAPGMALAARCLGEAAARLAPVPFAPCPLEPGRDTAAAMQAGAYHAGIGGVEAVIAGLEQRFGPLTVVVTGGLGGMLVTAGRCWDPDWTLRGAVVLARSATS